LRTFAHLVPFIGALMANRESAAIYASGSGMPTALQLFGALIWYAVLVAGIWMFGQRFGRWYPGRLLIIEWLRCRAQRHKSSTKPTDRSGIANLPRHRLLPILLGCSLLPSGFWPNVEIVRQRRCSTVAAVAWLAPCNALSYKIYFLGMSVLAIAGLDVVFTFLSQQVIPPLLKMAAVILVADLAWYGVRRFDDWCVLLYVRARFATR